MNIVIIKVSIINSDYSSCISKIASLGSYKIPSLERRSSYFLWDYAIDYKYQNYGYGTKALQELLVFLKGNYKAKNVTTTYMRGNEHAKHIYEKLGFVETDVVEEDGVHEVNMIIEI